MRFPGQGEHRRPALPRGSWAKAGGGGLTARRCLNAENPLPSERRCISHYGQTRPTDACIVYLSKALCILAPADSGFCMGAAQSHSVCFQEHCRCECEHENVERARQKAAHRSRRAGGSIEICPATPSSRYLVHGKRFWAVLIDANAWFHAFTMRYLPPGRCAARSMSLASGRVDGAKLLSALRWLLRRCRESCALRNHSVRSPKASISGEHDSSFLNSSEFECWKLSRKSTCGVWRR